MDVMPIISRPPVPGGPRAYRSRIRTFGPFVGLIPPALLGLVAALTLRNHTSTVRGVAGFLFAILAAPGLLVVGAPLTTGSGAYVPAILGSAVVWFAFGVVAARRSTRSPMASWGDFWREYLWMAFGLWVGVVLALVAANLVLGRALF